MSKREFSVGHQISLTNIFSSPCFFHLKTIICPKERERERIGNSHSHSRRHISIDAYVAASFLNSGKASSGVTVILECLCYSYIPLQRSPLFVDHRKQRMSTAYIATGPGTAVPGWLNKGDNAWQLTSATLVGIQSVPGLVILYGSMVKKKWAVNSAFMALYAFAAVLICWVIWGYKMAFGYRLLPFWGRAGVSLGQDFLVEQAKLPASAHFPTPMLEPLYPMATMVLFQFMFAGITLILIAGSLLGRMNIMAWMLFVPLWLTFSYTVGAFSLWGGGFLFQWGVMDYSGGYVIHLSSGIAGFTAAYWMNIKAWILFVSLWITFSYMVGAFSLWGGGFLFQWGVMDYSGGYVIHFSSGIAGFTAAYWVGPRLTKDRERFPPNNVLLMLAGAGLLWLGWAGFNGGDPYAANIDSSLAVLNTNICAAASLLVWTSLDVIFFGKPSVIGAVQGMITGLVCITPGAGLVQGWAAIIMGILSGSIPWFTMMVVHKKSRMLQVVDDTLGVFHTHAVAGLLGGLLTGLFAEPVLCNFFLAVPKSRGAVYGGVGGVQVGKQLVGALFIIVWNVVVTSLICLAIRVIVPLRMSDEQLLIGDDAVHGEEAYALWGDGEKYDQTRHETIFESMQGSPFQTSTLSSENIGINTRRGVNC